MSKFSEKILWTVSMSNAAEEARLLNHAQTIGATGVAIRTSNTRLASSIPRFKAHGISVYAWRWPACRKPKTAGTYFAPDQAKFVAGTLIPAGLSGYFADIESENDKGLNDWDDASFATIGKAFCNTIRAAAPAGFVFALTAGAPQPHNNPHIPWAPFVAASDYLLPQTYWRMRKNAGPTDINGGDPKKAIAIGDSRWAPIAAGKTIVPMLGELDTLTAAEIKDFGAELVARGEKRLHVYTDSGSATPAQLAAVAAL
jgi:hypothetical protein